MEGGFELNPQPLIPERLQFFDNAKYHPFYCLTQPFFSIIIYIIIYQEVTRYALGLGQAAKAKDGQGWQSASDG